MFGTWTLRYVRRKACLNIALLIATLFIIAVLFTASDVEPQTSAVQGHMVGKVRTTLVTLPSDNLSWATRSQRLNAACRDTKLYAENISSLTPDEKRLLYKQIIVNEKHQFLYCYVPKVACSNWKRVIKVIDGYLENVDKPIKMDHRAGLTLLSDLPEEEASYKLEHYYKFMFVREPLTRLLSAYRNKFQGHLEFRKRYESAIAQRYRPHFDVTDGANINITFSEFVQYLVDTNVSKMDMHWKPMSDLCHPCAVNYDYIGRFERIEEDSNYVLNAVGADVQFPKRQKWYKPTTQNILQKEFSEVSKYHTDNLVRKYEKDFDLFDYKASLLDTP